MPAAPTKVSPLAPRTECRLCRCMSVPVMAPPSMPHHRRSHVYPWHFPDMCSIGRGLDAGSGSSMHYNKCCAADWMGACGAKLRVQLHHGLPLPPPRVSRPRQRAMPVQLSRGPEQAQGCTSPPKHNCGMHVSSPTSCPGKPSTRTMGLATTRHACLTSHARQPALSCTADQHSVHCIAHPSVAGY